jgi:hypothetical protein
MEVADGRMTRKVDVLLAIFHWQRLIRVLFGSVSEPSESDVDCSEVPNHSALCLSFAYWTLPRFLLVIMRWCSLRTLLKTQTHMLI